MKYTKPITIALFAAGTTLVALTGCEDSRREKITELTAEPERTPMAAPNGVPLAEDPSPITPTPTPEVETKRPIGEPAIAQTDLQRTRTEALRARFDDVNEKWETIEARRDEAKAPHATERVEETLEAAREDLRSLQRADGTVWTDLEASFEAKLDDLEERIEDAEEEMRDG